jgi:hypothetical protein
MNTKSFIALVALSLAGTAALADGITVYPDTFVPTRTRAEVQAEVLQARAAGQLPCENDATGQLLDLKPAVVLTLTREQVRADLRKMPHPKLDVYNVLS